MKKLLLIISIAFIKFNMFATTPATAMETSGTTTANSCLVSFDVYTNGGGTTSVYVQYSTSSSTINSSFSVQLSNVSGGLPASRSTTLTSLSAATTYFWRTYVSNGDGVNYSNTYQFTTLPSGSVVVAEYNFDNTLNNLLGTSPFELNANVSFDTDRNGVANKCLKLNNGGTTAPILNLPVGSAARTVSIWVKSSLSTYADNQIFNYGSLGTNLACGLTRLISDGKLYFYGYSNDLSYLYAAPNANNWVHYVTTYQTNGTAKIYVNGVQFASGSKTGWNTQDSVFRLGKNVVDTNMFLGWVDDLKIYNYAISATEVSNLFNYNALSTQDFNTQNLKATIFPNPATDVLNIQIENEIKSVEIYSLLGQKVISENSKQIKLSNLVKGIYSIRIEDENGAVTTQKLIIK